MYIFQKALVLPIICSKRQNEDEKLFKKKINWDIKNSWFNWKYIITFKNMAEENISPELKLKNKDEARNDFLEEIEQNELMSTKNKRFIQL